MNESFKNRTLEEITRKIEDSYERRTPRSKAVMSEAQRFMPGGDTRRSVFFFPYPLFIDHADGCRIWDEDGNEYIDFHNCYTTMILGHGNPEVMAAIRRELDLGTTALGTFKKSVAQWAQMICERVKSVEQVRFTCTGTESVMMAIRAARAWTGKDKVIMEYGGYHGSYDSIVFPPDSRGLPRSVAKDTIIVPYNDKAALEKAIAENKGQVAALILEGLLGASGMIPAKDGYLKFAREITEKNDIVFILDEVISLRLDYGGIQNVEGIDADLTAFGKIVAGGTPGAAFGGRRDIMQLFDPADPALIHAGTLNANPVTAAAGTAQLKQVTPDLISRVNTLGESLADGVREVFAKANIKGQVTGTGSLCNVHFGPVPVTDGYISRESLNRELLHLFHLSLVNRGIFTPERGMFCISAPMTQREVKTAVEAVDDTVHELKPYIEQIWPELTAIG